MLIRTTKDSRWHADFLVFMRYFDACLWTDVLEVMFWDMLLPEVKIYWDTYYNSPCGFLFQAYAVYHAFSDGEESRSLEDLASALRLDARVLLSKAGSRNDGAFGDRAVEALFDKLIDRRDTCSLRFFLEHVSRVWLNDCCAKVGKTLWFLQDADGRHVFDVASARELTLGVSSKLGCDIGFTTACLFGNDRIHKTRELWNCFHDPAQWK